MTNRHLRFRGPRQGGSARVLWALAVPVSHEVSYTCEDSPGDGVVEEVVVAAARAA